MFPHALHLLLPLLHVVLVGVVGVVHLVELGQEERSELVLVPLSVLVEVVHLEEDPGVPILGSHVILVLPDFFQLILGHGVMHFLMILVLLLQAMNPVLLLLPLVRVLDVIQPLLLLKLLLHFVLLEVVPPLLVGLLQVLGGSLDQPLEVLLLESGVLWIHMHWNLKVLLVDALIQFILLHGQVPQPLDLPPLDLVQLGPDAVVHEFELVGDGAVADLVHVGVLQLLPEVLIGLQDLHDLLQVSVVLDAKVPVLAAVTLMLLLSFRLLRFLMSL